MPTTEPQAPRRPERLGRRRWKNGVPEHILHFISQLTPSSLFQR